MRSVYRVLAFVVAAEVVIQAAAIAFAVFGLGKWVEDGGTLNKATMESDDGSVGGAVGFMASVLRMCGAGGPPAPSTLGLRRVRDIGRSPYPAGAAPPQTGLRGFRGDRSRYQVVDT